MKKIVGLVLILAGLVLGFFGLPSILNNDSPAALLSKLQSGNDKAVTEKLSNIASNSVIEYDYTNAVKLNSTEKLFKKGSKQDLVHCLSLLIVKIRFIAVGFHFLCNHIHNLYLDISSL